MKPIKKIIIKDEKYEDGYSDLFAKITEKGDLVIDRMGVGPQEYVDIIDNTLKICVK